MENKSTTTCRVDDHLSPANNIPDSHNIVQKDVTAAVMQLNCDRREAHMVGHPMPWNEKTMEAYETIHRARHHQPGEAGSSTFRAGSSRPGTIVRRRP